MKLKTAWTILKTSGKEWNDDNVPTLSGSLAYSAIFSIAPLLIISVGITGYIFGKQGSGGEIFGSIQGLLGADGAQAIKSMVQAASRKPGAGLAATLVGLVALLVGASSVFQQLQQSLNLIWKVRASARSGAWSFLRQRLLSLAMILVIAFLLLVSLVLSAVLSGVGTLLRTRLPGGAALWQAINAAISFGVVTLLFAAIFKILPDVKLAWRDVLGGAAVTALFFTIGKELIGFYLGRNGVASAYGAAGSLIVVLLWVYYSSVILFFGVEVTRAYMIHAGKPLHPAEGARWITPPPSARHLKAA